MMEQLLEDQGEELLKKEVALAREGDRYARRFCLDRLFPTSKETPIEIELPSAENLPQLAAVTSSVLQAVTTGQITPGVGEQVANLLRLYYDVLKDADFEGRILSLERKLDPELEAVRKQEVQRAVYNAYQTVQNAFIREKILKGASNEPEELEGPSGSTRGPGGEEICKKP
jgi:hypothetical protein